MLDELVVTIESLKRRIREHRSYFDEGAPEARTRVSLIDPLLKALEWDVAEPSQVEVEPRMAQGRVDYALLGRAGEPVLLLEAKRLGDRNVPYDQIARYVVGHNLRRPVNIRYCAVTNGARWLVFDVSAQSPVIDVSVERDEPRLCALRLVCLWRSTLGDLGVVEQPDLETASGESTAGEFDSPSLSPTTQNQPRADWTPLNDETIRLGRDVLPSRVRFSDGHTASVSSWANMLVETVAWLHQSDLLGKDEMPFAVAGTRYCVSVDGCRPDGTPFGRPLRVRDTGIQVEGDFTAGQIVRFAGDLLKRYQVSPARVALQLVRRSTSRPT